MNTKDDSIAIIRTSEYFSADWYWQQYDDVALLGMEPAEHFLVFGGLLQRDPGPRFNVREYVNRNPELRKSGENPLLHYHRKAQQEDPKQPSNGGPKQTDPLHGMSAEAVGQVKASFDAEFYLSSYPDVARSGEDPFMHYMTSGWRVGLDPSPDFSTSYYLQRAPDVRKSGKNPLVHYVLHGKAERRPALPHQERLRRLEYAPKVTAVVPNYNHARFLRQRIDSILNQTYPNVDVLLLDDCSSDDSRDVIAEYCERHPGRVRSILNERNAGNVFRQWRKGVEAADGELVWICESDDFCEPDFLASIVPHFKDRSVNIAFGRIQIADRDGDVNYWLDTYREGAEPGIWAEPLVRPAQQWFAGGFGVNNVIANVGGCVWRRQALPDAVWEEAQTYSILGDWFLYCQVAGGGQIAYEPAAVAYFRQHGVNTSVASYSRPSFYLEHHRLMVCLRERWDVPAATVDKFVDKVFDMYERHGVAQASGSFDQYVDRAYLKTVSRKTPHVLIAFLGFHSGGGEVFPIALANALRGQGWLVSMLAYDMAEVNAQMAASLDSSIPVYSAAQVDEMGVAEFLANAGVSIVHTHMLSLDNFFIEKHRIRREIPYLVTLHGSYEACGISEARMQVIADRVDRFVYTAERNLAPFESLRIDAKRFSKTPNGMPDDPRPFPKNRQELGIADDAVVFAFVARGIREKGWRVAASAFQQLRDANPGVRMHLLMVGAGPRADRIEEEYGGDKDITFLGYQACINGLYRMSDCALVPTRFSGESFPLCVIQALQSGTPVVATRIGEIASMIAPEGEDPAGVLVDYAEDSATFVDDVREAMARMLDPAERNRLSANARSIGERFDIEKVAAVYGRLYADLLGQ